MHPAMDGNRDDAERCLQLAAAALSANDIPKATRLLVKSRRMYPLPEQQARLDAALKLHNISTSAASSSSTAPPSENQPGLNDQDKVKQQDDEKPRQPSPAMLAAVRAVHKLRAKSHYDVLAVPRDADDIAIKRAYRKLALRLHPDRNLAPGADDAFKRVGQAFVVLSDPQRRRHYDQFGTDGPEHQPVRNNVRRRRKCNANAARRRPAGAGPGFEEFDFMRQEMTTDELFEFLFQAAARGGDGFAATQGFGPGGFFSGAARGDDGDGAREYREYEGEGESFWERFKPMILMFVVISLAMLIAQDGAQQPYSLFRTDFYSKEGVTRNQVRYYTASRMDLTQVKVRRRLEWNVDMAALEEYSNRCRKEVVQEEFLLKQSRRWLIGSKEKERFREKYEMFEKPWCGKARELGAQLQRQRAY